MKRRAFNVLNFISFNILFFAIYLNFIHKDVNRLPAVTASASAAAKSVAAGNATAPQLTEQHKAENARN